MSTAIAVEAVRKRVPIERFFTSWDGTQIFFRAWLPAEPAERALSCCIVDTNTQDDFKISSMRLIFPITPSSRGMREATAALPASVVTRIILGAS
jgi:hypothetical protein